jgi:3-hydroxyisobutyrate dehydrogenase-like beta-hydroxyacid dehydrogenase
MRQAIMGAAVGFIGFGEAGYHIAKGLHGADLSSIFAYDVALESDAHRGRIETRAADADVALCKSLADLARCSEIIFCTVVSSVAITVAKEAVAHLGGQHYYVDLNSTSPAVKKQIAEIIAPSGARFVEAAVMAAVPPFGHKVPMLLCGEAAAKLIGRLSAYGMSLEDFGSEIGRATATKMFRSIVVKGLEALLLECTMAASRYGVCEKVLESVGAGYPGIDWNQLANYLIGRTAVHGERRAHEMEEVALTLQAMGIEPIMAEAAAKRIMGFARLGLKERFDGKAPESYHEVMRALEEAPETRQ